MLSRLCLTSSVVVVFGSVDLFFFFTKYLIFWLSFVCHLRWHDYIASLLAAPPQPSAESSEEDWIGPQYDGDLDASVQPASYCHRDAWIDQHRTGWHHDFHLVQRGAVKYSLLTEILLNS